MGYYAPTHLDLAIVVVDVDYDNYQNTLLYCHGDLPVIGLGKDLMGISQWFHEVGTHLDFDKGVAEHSLARQVEPYSHHIGKELVEHTAEGCSRNQEDAECVHLLVSGIHAGLFSSVCCWRQDDVLRLPDASQIHFQAGFA